MSNDSFLRPLGGLRCCPRPGRAASVKPAPETLSLEGHGAEDHGCRLSLGSTATLCLATACNLACVVPACKQGPRSQPLGLGPEERSSEVEGPLGVL